MDQLFGPGGMDLNTPLHPGSSAFNKFLSQHKLAMAEDNGPKTGSGSHIETIPREQGTSRFARFFSHNIEENFQETNSPARSAPAPASRCRATQPASLPRRRSAIRSGQPTRMALDSRKL